MEQLREYLQKVTWTHVVLFIGLFAAYSFFFQDHSELEQKTNLIQGSESEIKNLQNKILEAQKFEEEYEKKKKDIVELEAQLRGKRAELPKVFSVPEMLNDLLFEAKQVGLEVIKITPAPAETKRELYYELPIEINTKGTFLQLFIFLERLTKLKRLVGVTAVQVSSLGINEKITLKGTTGALSGKQLLGGEKSFLAIQGTIKLLAFRID